MTAKRIAVVDVETTGINPNEHFLLEIAVVVVDAKTLEPVDERGFHAIVKHRAETVQTLREHAGEYVRQMHEKTGLWDVLPDGEPLTVIDAALTEYLSMFGGRRELPVMGNSVRLDMNFIDAYLPDTSAYLDYHMRDVSSLAGFVTDYFDDVAWYAKANDHTAMTDVRECIKEAKHFRELAFPRTLFSEKNLTDAFLNNAAALRDLRAGTPTDRLEALINQNTSTSRESWHAAVDSVFDLR